MEKLTPTQHNLAREGDLADVVVMPGDPSRAKYIAENFLDQAVLVNDLRMAYAYTGTYKGKRVSVMAHGMGAPSIAIYAHELFAFYGVKNIIRIGTAGALSDRVKLGGLVAATGACYNTGYASQFGLDGVFSAVASLPLLNSLIEAARPLGADCAPGLVLSSDVYYHCDPQRDLRWAQFGVLAVEMETAALYLEAARTGKNAAALLTVTGNLATGEYMPAERNHQVYDSMIAAALESAGAFAGETRG